jgi:transcriptional regulator with XRE-family HTH domain
MIYPKQIRAARGLLGINQTELALRSEVSPGTVKRIEALSSDDLRVTVDTLQRIQRALEADGIVFIEPDEMLGPGVRFRDPKAR